YGAVRAGAGLLITSYKTAHAAASRDPVGDNAPGIAMLKQAVKLGETFSQAATTHKTVALAAHAGAAKANKSTLDERAAPLKALLKTVSGMVGKDSLGTARSDASGKNTTPDADKIPHLSDAVIAIAAKAGLGVSAGQSMQLANGETVTLSSGTDMQFITGGRARMQTGQAIGVLGGAVKPGEGDLGLQMIAAQGAIELQAQADVLRLQAREDIKVMSVNAHVDWASAKCISLSTAGGANITIEGGNITVQCPGKIIIHAGKKSFMGPEKLNYEMPPLYSANMPEDFSNRLDVHDLFMQNEFGRIAYKARLADKRVVAGVLDLHGRSDQIYAKEGDEIEILAGLTLDQWDLITDYDPQVSDDIGNGD
uniref:DUF2345 domain-containing protein n=1 Tax=Massilia sp. TWP1-3-3 TaxID=2804573 RepID=UPI003CF91C53